jgi:lipoate-protein ligase A
VPAQPSGDKKKWRLIFTGLHEAFLNMALDEALLLSCQDGISPPTLRLYQWNPPAVSIGYFQSTEKTVNLQKCKASGIQVVRRITGGRAVLHEDEITYSICASSDHFAQLGRNINQTYERISMALLASLRGLGIAAEWVKPPAGGRSGSLARISSKPCFLSNSRYEITVGGRKLIGSAQRRFSFRSNQGRKDSFIQHGSILTGGGRYSLAELLPDELATVLIRQNLSQKSTNMEQVLRRRVRTDEIISALKVGFQKFFTCVMEDSTASEQELEAAQSLLREKYLTEEWNLRR